MKARTVEICVAARPAAESPSCPSAAACRILSRCLAANRVGITVTTTTRLHCRPPRCLIDNRLATALTTTTSIAAAGPPATARNSKPATNISSPHRWPFS
jgi:hypothetical protein